MTAALIIAALYIAGICVAAYLLATAPEGYETDGFHFGREPDA